MVTAPLYLGVVKVIFTKAPFYCIMLYYTMKNHSAYLTSIMPRHHFVKFFNLSTAICKHTKGMLTLYYYQIISTNIIKNKTNMIVQNIAGIYVALLRNPHGTGGGYIATGASFAEAIHNALARSLSI